jgi:hypothetical protein
MLGELLLQPQLTLEFGRLVGWMKVSAIHLHVDLVVCGEWGSSITTNTDDCDGLVSL